MKTLALSACQAHCTSTTDIDMLPSRYSPQDERQLSKAVQFYEMGFKYATSPWERETLEKGLRNFVVRLSERGHSPGIDELLKR